MSECVCVFTFNAEWTCTLNGESTCYMDGHVLPNIGSIHQVAGNLICQIDKDIITQQELY